MANSADQDQLASSEAIDLDLHCLLGQGMSCSAREGLKTNLQRTTSSSFTSYMYLRVKLAGVHESVYMNVQLQEQKEKYI